MIRCNTVDEFDQMRVSLTTRVSFYPALMTSTARSDSHFAITKFQSMVSFLNSNLGYAIKSEAVVDAS